jgi:hypothetical protein
LRGGRPAGYLVYYVVEARSLLGPFIASSPPLVRAVFFA